MAVKCSKICCVYNFLQILTLNICFHKAKPGNSYLLSAILFWLLLFEWRFLFHGPTRAMSKNYGESNKLMITFFCKLDLSKFICVMDIIKQCTHHHLPQLIPIHSHPPKIISNTSPPTQNKVPPTQNTSHSL